MGISHKKLAVVSSLGLGALSLVGVGAGASFTDSVSATQHISTGTLSMAISSVDANGNPDGTLSNNGKSITFDPGRSGSHIDEQHTITVTNTGTLPLNVSSVSVLPGSANDSQLANDVTTTIGISTLTVAQAQASGWACRDCMLAPGQSFDFPFNFSAADLGNADEGQNISPTVTLGASEVDPAAHYAKTAGGPTITSKAS